MVDSKSRAGPARHAERKEFAVFPCFPRLAAQDEWAMTHIFLRFSDDTKGKLNCLAPSGDVAPFAEALARFAHLLNASVQVGLPLPHLLAHP